MQCLFHFIPCLGQCLCSFIANQGYISFLPRAIFHFLPRVMSMPFHSYPGEYLILTQGYISLLAYGNVYAISFLPRAIFHFLPSVMFIPFHSCPGQYFIACLVRCLCYFIPTQGNISFLAWGDAYTISFLPRWIFHSLPSVMFMPFHSYPGLYFIACLMWCLCDFISCLGWYFYHFIPTQLNTSFFA